MQNSSVENKASLLRSFVLAMLGIGVLPLLISAGMWNYSNQVLNREEALLQELLPELDAAQNLTAATATLQTLALQLRDAQNLNELGPLKFNVETRMSQIRTILSTLSSVGASRLSSLRNSVDDMSRVIAEMDRVKQQQFQLSDNIELEQQTLLDSLEVLKAAIEEQIIDLTESLSTVVQSVDQVPESADSSGSSASVNLIKKFEANSLSIQDYLLINQDVSLLTGEYRACVTSFR